MNENLMLLKISIDYNSCNPIWYKLNFLFSKMVSLILLRNFGMYVGGGRVILKTLRENSFDT